MILTAKDQTCDTLLLGLTATFSEATEIKWPFRLI